MSKTRALILFVLLLHASWVVRGQKPVGAVIKVDTSFKALVNQFNLRARYRKDTPQLPTLYVSRQFKVVLADSAWHLTKRERSLENPFSQNEADRYPLSYSVLYQNRLVSLLAPGCSSV